MNKPLTDPWFEAYFFCDANSEGGYRRCLVEEGDIPFEKSQGIVLWCPCGVDDPRYPLDGGRPHGVMIPFLNPPCGVPVPENFGPFSSDDKTHPRWVVGGSGLHNLTLTPSVNVGSPSCWHGFIKNGIVS